MTYAPSVTLQWAMWTSAGIIFIEKQERNTDVIKTRTLASKAVLLSQCVKMRALQLISLTTKGFWSCRITPSLSVIVKGVAFIVTGDPAQSKPSVDCVGWEKQTNSLESVWSTLRFRCHCCYRNEMFCLSLRLGSASFVVHIWRVVTTLREVLSQFTSRQKTLQMLATFGQLEACTESIPECLVFSC